MCLRIFQKETKAFPDYKNNKLTKAKIWDFSKENTVGVILSGARVMLVCDWCARVQQLILWAQPPRTPHEVYTTYDSLSLRFLAENARGMPAYLQL